MNKRMNHVMELSTNFPEIQMKMSDQTVSMDSGYLLTL
jgi:hypothetical protein